MTSASLRTLSLRLEDEQRTVKGFTSTQWHVAMLEPGDNGPHAVDLQLYMTERAAYRHNLNAERPRLFVRCSERQGAASPEAITASQEVAAGWMDGDWLVLDTSMPLAIQAWIEAYLVRHGEAPDEGRKKKRKGAGRARGDQA
ncbi:Protein of unknown function [Modicisalibacter ilicicola DSM 19980]|uniref:DUF3305 domain-containing protein n=1 Tax=Modicisalibacter ilicicola DSM 19980 TaxID=1121942 RepID=A0A1M4XKD9_9GAMM|nr:DUF3305 domain-containing protein [Halomonas ilicicola]SHE93975.1 Protein of unknown function [Halomonas ilicicola DSM 19980]